MSSLPTDLKESAKEYGVIIRERKIKCAKEFLGNLFRMAFFHASLKMLAAIATVKEVTNDNQEMHTKVSASDEAWRKKIAKSVPWLIHILNSVLPKNTAKNIKFYQNQKLPIELLDGSIVQQHGKKGDTGRGGNTLRLHMRYSLNNNCMQEVLLTDNHTAERANIFSIKPNHIYIADAGYGKGVNKH